MSWRTIAIAHRAKLELKLGSMVIRGEAIKKVHLSEIAVVIIETTEVSITASLLCELMKRKIKVIFCDERKSPISELIPYYGSHDSSAKIRQQVQWLDSVKRDVWTLIVSEKIRKQSQLLLKVGNPAYALLEGYIEEVKPGDTTNREGHAAKVYFNGLFGQEFSRGQENSINAALNYGYAILLSAFNREICANGYLTQLGVFHDNMFNPYNLASDLMEPFRVLVDQLVLDYNPVEFGPDEKHMMLTVLNGDVMIDSNTQTVLNAIRIYTKSVLDSIADGDLEKMRFYDQL